MRTPHSPRTWRFGSEGCSVPRWITSCACSLHTTWRKLVGVEGAIKLKRYRPRKEPSGGVIDQHCAPLGTITDRSRSALCDAGLCCDTRDDGRSPASRRRLGRSRSSGPYRAAMVSASKAFAQSSTAWNRARPTLCALPALPPLARRRGRRGAGRRTVWQAGENGTPACSRQQSSPISASKVSSSGSASPWKMRVLSR